MKGSHLKSLLIGKQYAFKVAIDEYNAKKLLHMFNVLYLSDDPEIIQSLIVSATPNKRPVRHQRIVLLLFLLMTYILFLILGS